jgi:para-nitrobenzyl esterase
MYQLIRYWKGIPFGETTFGVNRFRAPIPKASWSGVLNTTSWAPGCQQIHHNPDVPDITSEDCLNLNVYAPVTAVPGGPATRAVMIW